MVDGLLSEKSVRFGLFAKRNRMHPSVPSSSFPLLMTVIFVYSAATAIPSPLGLCIPCCDSTVRYALDSTTYVKAASTIARIVATLTIVLIANLHRSQQNFRCAILLNMLRLPGRENT